jgi:cytochrome b561
MPNLRTLFRVLKIAGLIVIAAMVLRSEWMFMHGHPPHILNPKIHFFAVASVLLIPIYYVVLAVTLVGWIGGRRMDKKAAAAVAVEAPVEE